MTLKGVNLGGWLIPEKWMTPSLFKGTEARDLYSLCQTAEGRKRVRAHVKTFITEADFEWLAEQGIELIRLPVGYWSLESDGAYEATSGVLDWVFEMAEQYGLRVLLDLHAAPGSQNGHDHSGRIGEAAWFYDERHQARTITVLEGLAHRYRGSPALWGIELLNEPQAKLGRYRTLRRFYRQSYERLVAILRPGTHIVFSDGFRPLMFAGVIRPQAEFPVVMDVHIYQFTSWQRYLPPRLYLRTLPLQGLLLRMLQWRQPVMIGEWSGVIRRQSLKRMSTEAARATQLRHIDVQRTVYGRVAARCYWSYKTERPGIWNLRHVVEKRDVTP